MARFAALLALGALAVSARLNNAQAKRQSGTVDPSTVSDCTYFADYPDSNNSGQGDSCASLASYWGISLAQFVSYNPVVGSTTSCTLQSGHSYCVEENYGQGPKSTSTPVQTPTGTPKPSPTQDGLVSNCNAFYKVQPGDYCQAIVDQYGTFTLDQFYSWNPAVKSDCSGLAANVYVCVGVPGTPTAKPSSATPTPSGPSPEQTGITSDCKAYYKVQSGDSCQSIVDQYGTFTLGQFYTWNPAVGSDCSHLFLGYYYCVGVSSTPTVKPSVTQSATPTATGPSPTQSGIRSDCTKYYKAVSGDSCAVIADKFGTFSVADFESWNPAVGSDCSHLFLDYYYCVAVPGTPSQRTSSSSPTPTATGPSPTQSGIRSDCTKYYKAVSGDSCAVIADKFGTFSVSDFESWNPAVGSDCSHLFLDYYYCVAVPGTPSQRTSSSPTPTPTTNGPQPQQPGIVSNCNRWWKVNAGDSCYNIAKGFGISDDQFFGWNPSLHRDCSNLFAGYYVCVGTS